MSKYYYAYGIRNSFGMDFDPVTGKLWDEENGPAFGDEINLVEPGFNSGWIRVMGPLSRSVGVNTDQLVNYPGSHYADPVFSWKNPVAVTGIEAYKKRILEEYKLIEYWRWRSGPKILRRFKMSVSSLQS